MNATTSDWASETEQRVLDAALALAASEGWTPKMTAMAGAACGVAGALFANLTLFVSPSIMHWTRSGEILMMVILGGISSLIGPVFGAAAYLILESVLSRLTEHWQAVLGPLLILVVLFSKSGLYGLLFQPLQFLWPSRSSKPAR